MKSMKIKDEYGAMESVKDGYYPTFTINEKAIPELKDKKVGDMCELKVKVKITSSRADSKNNFHTVEVREGESVEY